MASFYNSGHDRLAIPRDSPTASSFPASRGQSFNISRHGSPGPHAENEKQTSAALLPPPAGYSSTPSGFLARYKTDRRYRRRAYYGAGVLLGLIAIIALAVGLGVGLHDKSASSSSSGSSPTSSAPSSSSTSFPHLSTYGGTSLSDFPTSSPFPSASASTSPSSIVTGPSTSLVSSSAASDPESSIISASSPPSPAPDSGSSTPSPSSPPPPPPPSSSAAAAQATSAPASASPSPSPSDTNANPTTLSNNPSSGPSQKYLISFGASYMTTGSDPVNGAHPSSQNPIGNPSYPGHTTTGGPNVVDFLTTRYNNGQPIYLYNYAVSGATTDNSLVAGTAGFSFLDQVTNFALNIAQKPSYAPWNASTALFAVWIGINDVGIGHLQSNWQTVLPLISAKYFAQLSAIYAAGGRNFLIFNVPPMQRTPDYLGQSSSAQAAEASAVSAYNALMASGASAFRTAHPDASLTLYDVTNDFTTALDNPTSYGAPNNSCFNSDGTSCLWWNDYHAGQAIHDLVARGASKAVGWFNTY